MPDACAQMGGAGVNAVGRLRLRQFEALPVNKMCVLRRGARVW